jgi:hypothetical protein
MKRTIALVAVAGVFVAAFAAQLPELRRYLKMKSM